MLTIVSRPIMSIANNIAINNNGFSIRNKQTRIERFVAFLSLVLHNLLSKKENKVHLSQDMTTCIGEVAESCAEILKKDDLTEGVNYIKPLNHLHASLKIHLKDGILYINIQENKDYWFPQEKLLLSVDLSKKTLILDKFKNIASKSLTNNPPTTVADFNASNLNISKIPDISLTNNPQKTVEDFNAGKLNICVTMLGHQIDQLGYDNVINKNTSQFNEETFKTRKSKRNKGDNFGSATNFSATAFDNQTQVHLIRTKKLAEKKETLNVGYVLNPNKLEPIQVATAGDAWTKHGGTLQEEEVLNPKSKLGCKKTITKYESNESKKLHKGDIVQPKNKAYKRGKLRTDNNDTIRALVKYTNKHEWGGDNASKKHVARSATTNEVLFMPNTDTYFEAIAYILVDNSQLKCKDITRHKNWKSITDLANSVNKPILILQEDGKTLEYYDQKKTNINSEQINENFNHIVQSVEKVNLTDYQQNISQKLINELPKNKSKHIASKHMNNMPAKYFPLNITLSGHKDSDGKYLLSNNKHEINLNNLKDYETKFEEIFNIKLEKYCNTYPMVIFKNNKMEKFAKQHYSSSKYKSDSQTEYTKSGLKLYYASNDIESRIAKTASICANYGVLSFKNPSTDNNSKTKNVPGVLYDAIGLNKTDLLIEEYEIFCQELYSTIWTASNEQQVKHLIISPVGTGVMAKDSKHKQKNKMALLQTLCDSSLDTSTKITLLDYTTDYSEECFKEILAKIKQKFPNLIILSGEKDASLGGWKLSDRTQENELTGLVNASAPAAYGGLMTNQLGDTTIEENIRHHLACIVQPDVRIKLYPDTVKIIEV